MEHSGAFAAGGIRFRMEALLRISVQNIKCRQFIHRCLRPSSDRGRIGKMSFCRVDGVVSGILQRVVGHYSHLFARDRPIRLKSAVRVAVNDIGIDGCLDRSRVPVG